MRSKYQIPEVKNEWLGNSGSYMPYEYSRWFTNALDRWEYESLSYDVVVTGDLKHKCSHCGQWGAARSACTFCGAPID